MWTCALTVLAPVLSDATDMWQAVACVQLQRASEPHKYGWVPSALHMYHVHTPEGHATS